ncbi:hypothetical protein ACKWTF_000681 [Chironomus riparius]
MNLYNVNETYELVALIIWNDECVIKMDKLSIFLTKLLKMLLNLKQAAQNVARFWLSSSKFCSILVKELKILLNFDQVVAQFRSSCLTFCSISNKSVLNVDQVTQNVAPLRSSCCSILIKLLNILRNFE